MPASTKGLKRACQRRPRWWMSTWPTWTMPRASRESPTDAVSMMAMRTAYCEGLRRCFIASCMLHLSDEFEAGKTRGFAVEGERCCTSGPCAKGGNKRVRKGTPALPYRHVCDVYLEFVLDRENFVGEHSVEDIRDLLLRLLIA